MVALSVGVGGLRVLNAAMQALLAGQQLAVVLARLRAVNERMTVESRAEPTAAELDLIMDRLETRQERMERDAGLR